MSILHKSLSYQTLFHESDIPTPYYLYQTQNTASFIPNKLSTTSYQHIQYAYHPPIPAQTPWELEYKCTQLQSTDTMSPKYMAIYFQREFDEIKRQQEFDLQQNEWAYQAYHHEKDLEDQTKQYEEYLAVR